MRLTAKRVLSLTMASALTVGLLGGCAKNISEKNYAKTVVVEYNGYQIMLDEANFLARLSQYSYEEAYYYYGGMKISWDTEYSDGTMQDSVKTDVMTKLVQTALLCSAADEYGVSLSEDDEAKIQDQVDSFMDEAGTKMVNASGATEELVTRVYTHNALANKVYEAMIADVDTTAEPEDYRAAAIDYLLIAEPEEDTTDTSASADTTGETETETEEETTTEAVDLSAYEDLAADLLARVQAGEAVSDLADEYADSEEFTVTSQSVTVAADDYAETFGPTAWALATGESTSCYVEGTGWYVLYCENEMDADATQSEIDDEIASRKASLFSEKYEVLAEEAGDYTVDNRAWDNVTFDTAVYDYDAADEAAEEATATDSETTEAETTEAETTVAE